LGTTTIGPDLSSTERRRRVLSKLFTTASVAVFLTTATAFSQGAPPGRIPQVYGSQAFTFGGQMARNAAGYSANSNEQKTDRAAESAVESRDYARDQEQTTHDVEQK
jgi:hypothetical protein